MARHLVLFVLVVLGLAMMPAAEAVMASPEPPEVGYASRVEDDGPLWQCVDRSGLQLVFRWEGGPSEKYIPAYYIGNNQGTWASGLIPPKRGMGAVYQITGPPEELPRPVWSLCELMAGWGRCHQMAECENAGGDR